MCKSVHFQSLSRECTTSGNSYIVSQFSLGFQFATFVVVIIFTPVQFIAQSLHSLLQIRQHVRSTDVCHRCYFDSHEFPTISAQNQQETRKTRCQRPVTVVRTNSAWCRCLCRWAGSAGHSPIYLRVDCLLPLPASRDLAKCGLCQ